jgi:transposase
MQCPSKTNSTPYAKTEIGLKNLLKQKETSMNLTETLHANDSKTKESLLVAIEMGLKQWHLGMAVQGQTRKRHNVVAGGDYAALSAAIAHAKAKLGLSSDSTVVCCYEAGRDGFHPYHALTALGHRVWVVDSSSIEVSRQFRRHKSDAVDREKLLALMQRYAGGEKTALRVVRVPTVEQEDLRQLPREREELLRERRRTLNRVEALLFTQGHREIPGTAARLCAWLDQHPHLGAHLRRRLDDEVARLKLTEEQLAAVQARQRALLSEAPATADGAVPLAIVETARRLCRLKAIAWAGAWVLSSEIFGWRQFRNRREVGGAFGLAPTPYSSGESQREQGIGKTGNRRARAMLVELSWLWLRYQPDSLLSRWFQERFASAGKRQRRIGIVALARKLAVALWRYLATGTIPPGAQLKAA